jgi:hypothetical protein
MIIYPSKPEDQYFEIIEKSEPVFLVMGETGETWTTAVLDFLTKQNLSVYFFPWSKIPELRLQLGVVKYPLCQLWAKKECAKESFGYQEEELESLVRYFLHLKHGV